MSAYQIRPLKERDIESIIGIDALVTGAAGPDRAGFWRGLLSMGLAPPDPDYAGAEVLPAAPHLVEVAVSSPSQGGAVVGFVIGDVQSWQFGIPRHGRIVTIGVHPDHRRHGVAKMLAESLIASFRKMRLPFVHCMVRPGDPLGEFFRSVGFRESEFDMLEKQI